MEGRASTEAAGSGGSTLTRGHRRHRWLVAAAVAAALVASLEVGARVYERLRRPPAAQLDAYELLYRTESGAWSFKPRPGYEGTLESMLEEKTRRGAHAGVRLLRAWRERGLSPGDEVVMRIDERGFKGPAAAVPKPAQTLRILCVGDSCTFGAWIDRSSYPRVLERELRQRFAGDGDPFDIEVVNGGVEGYHTWHAVERLPEYVALEPDLVTILLGWNEMLLPENLPAGLWSEDAWSEGRLRETLGRSALYRTLGQSLAAWREARAGEQPASASGGEEDASAGPPEQDLIYEPSDGETARLLSVLEPRAYRRRLRQLAETFEASGARVVIITLPGLAAPGLPEDALRRAHLAPGRTRNVHHVQLITERFNEVAREVASEHPDRLLIDLAGWLEARADRFDLFSDSVHLTPEGQEAQGIWLAQELAPAVRALHEP